MKLISDSCIRIPVNETIKQQPWFKSIVKFLTRKERPFNGGRDDFEIRKYYGVDPVLKELLIPKLYPIQQFGHKVKINLPEGKDINVTSNVVPRNPRQEESIEYFLNNDSGVLCLSPGEGKTVVAVDSICKIGKKAIVLVHKDALVDQWYERFLEHTNIHPDRMMKLQSKGYEKILLESDIVLGTVQSMCSLINRKHDIKTILRLSGFGVAFWDECHTSAGAEQFSKTGLFIPARKKFGLSATPKRPDGNTDVIHMHLGEVFIPRNKDIDTMIPKIVMLKFDHGMFPAHTAYIMGNTDFDRKNGKKRYGIDKDRYLKLLITSKNSKYLPIMKKVVSQIARSDRTMILLSDRIKTLDALSKVCKNKDEVGFFIPRSGKERDSHLLRRLVFSTYGSCRDGVDKKEVDCLVLSNPTNNWEQAIGRAVRNLPGKKEPVIMDIVDIGVEEYVKWSEKRKKEYIKKGWKVEERLLK